MKELKQKPFETNSHYQLRLEIFNQILQNTN